MGIHSLMQNLTVKDAVAARLEPGSKPSKKEIYQNRFGHGPNFGAMFVAEKWIDDSIFPDGSPGDSELAALEGLSKDHSIDDVKAKFEERWNNFITDQDWEWLASKGVNSIRLPIGFYNVAGGRFTKGTPFEKYAKVYENSWNKIKDLFAQAAKYNIGILLDFHALPGGANKDAHSGTNSGKDELWHDSKYRDLALDVYKYAAKDLENVENLVGFELVNEAPYDASKLKAFYLDAVRQIRKYNDSAPLVLSDGWDLNGWRETIKKLDEEVSSSKKPATAGLVIDTHIYRAFSEEDKKRSAENLVDDSKNAVPRDDDTDVLVGEYSCVLDEQSWKQGGNRDELVVRFGQDQTRCFENCARAGAYFWTYKFCQGMGGEWDFRVMTDRGAIPTYPNEVDVNKPNLDESLGQALDAHKNYWESQDKNQDWEHWRFEEGFRQGFEDAKSFAEFHGSRIGRIAAWKTARLAQHIHEKGRSDKTFVYSQAFVQGVDAFWSQV